MLMLIYLACAAVVAVVWLAVAVSADANQPSVEEQLAKMYGEEQLAEMDGEEE